MSLQHSNLDILESLHHILKHFLNLCVHMQGTDTLLYNKIKFLLFFFAAKMNVKHMNTAKIHLIKPAVWEQMK